MIIVLTSSTYDLLHKGHIDLLRRAKELGDYLIVDVTSDSVDRNRGKLNGRTLFGSDWVEAKVDDNRWFTSVFDCLTFKF